MSEDTMCYIAVAPCCGNVVMAVVEIQENRKLAAREVAKAIRDGLEVTRITVAEVRRLPNFRRCTCHDKPKTGKQEAMFIPIDPSKEARDG